MAISQSGETADTLQAVRVKVQTRGIFKRIFGTWPRLRVASSEQCCAPNQSHRAFYRALNFLKLRVLYTQNMFLNQKCRADVNL